MIERFLYSDCHVEVTSGRYVKVHSEAYDLSDSEMLYGFKVTLPPPFHNVGPVGFTLSSIDPREVQMAIDRETVEIIGHINHNLAARHLDTFKQQ